MTQQHMASKNDFRALNGFCFFFDNFEWVLFVYISVYKFITTCFFECLVYLECFGTT